MQKHWKRAERCTKEVEIWRDNRELQKPRMRIEGTETENSFQVNVSEKKMTDKDRTDHNQIRACVSVMRRNTKLSQSPDWRVQRFVWTNVFDAFIRTCCVRVSKRTQLQLNSLRTNFSPHDLPQHKQGCEITTTGWSEWKIQSHQKENGSGN